MSADIGALTTWSTTAASNQPDASDSIANLDDNLQKIQAEVKKYLATKGTDIASASTVDLSTATGNYVHITGTTTVTALGTVAAGFRFLLVFDGILTFTHNGTSLILPGAANITTTAGDRCEVVSLGSGNWRCLWYQRASGDSITGATLYQPLDTTLTALAGALTAANKIPYATALNTLGELNFIDEDSMATNSATALPSQQSVKAYADTKNIATQVAPGTSGNVLTSNGSAWTSAAAAAIVEGTAVSATGTSIDFTSLPASTKRITVMLDRVSSDGVSRFIIQIGDSGGVETTGYDSGAFAPGASIDSTTGYVLMYNAPAATDTFTCVAELVNITGDTWLLSSTGYDTNGNATAACGTKPLTGTLDRVRLTTTNGTDAFDSGTVNITYEV